MGGKSRRKRATTARSFEGQLIESMQQAVAIKEGRARPARAYTLPRTARESEVRPPKRHSAADVLRIRRRLKLSQTVFANALAKSPATVRSREQGHRDPDPAANRMLEIAERYPAVI